MSARNAVSPSSFAFVRSVEVLVFVEQLVRRCDFLLARVDDDVVRVVDDLLEITQREVDRLPIGLGSVLKNQMWATGTASSM